MSDCNGFLLSGLNQASNRVSIQSNVQDTWMLTRRRYKWQKPIEHEIGASKNELIVLKCQDGAESAEIQIKPLGDKAGTMIAESSRRGAKTLRVGTPYTFVLQPGEALIIRTTTIMHPTGPGAGMIA